MSNKTTAAKRIEAYQAISMVSKAKAFAIYSRQNARGKIKAGDTFTAWLDRIIARTVADWAIPSNAAKV